MNQEQMASTHIWHGDKCFNISTANRESSAVLAAGHIYAETIVWEWNPETRERGKLLWMGEAPRDSLKVHFDVANRIKKTGSPEEES